MRPSFSTARRCRMDVDWRHDVFAQCQSEHAELAEVVGSAGFTHAVDGCTRLHRSDTDINHRLAERIQDAAGDHAAFLQRNCCHVERLSRDDPVSRDARGIERNVSGLLNGEPVRAGFQFVKGVTAVLICDRLQSRPPSKGKDDAGSGNRNLSAGFENAADARAFGPLICEPVGGCAAAPTSRQGRGRGAAWDLSLRHHLTAAAGALEDAAASRVVGCSSAGS